MTKFAFLCSGIVAASLLQARVFDAVSIKPNVSGQRGYALPPPKGGRFTAGNVPLTMLVTYAYHLQEQQLAGATGWMNIENFDVEAKAPFPATEDQVRVMLQPVLVERFKLKFGRTTRTALAVGEADDPGSGHR